MNIYFAMRVLNFNNFESWGLFGYFFEFLIFITAKEVLKAVDTGQLELLKIFLKTRQDKNPVVYISNSGSRLTVLHNAAYEGQLGIIRWYREALNFSNINPKDSKGNTPLSWAIEQEKQDVVEYFIDIGYGQNVTCKTTSYK